MNEDVTALLGNETFEITPLPDCRYSQIPNVDYHETFSPTARITSVRMLMQLAVQDKLVVHQADVKTAYLNAPIYCEIISIQ